MEAVRRAGVPAWSVDMIYAAPDQTPAEWRADLARILEPEWVIGVGAFAARRAEDCLGDRGIRVGQILHPSPANPRANRDWEGEVRRQLSAMGLCSG